MSVTPTRPWAAIDLQRDKRWAGHELGTGQGVSIGDYGCLLTCHAMTAGYYGHSVTPLDLDLLYVQHDVFVSNGQGQADLLDDDALARLYGDVSVQAVHDYTGVPADLSVLATVSADPTLTAVLEVDFNADPTDGTQTHFVVLDHYDGQHVYVLDPWYGDGVHADDIRIHFGDPAVTIQKVVVYRGTPTAPGPTIGMGRPGRVQVLMDMTLRRTPTLDKSPSNVFFLPSGQPQLCYHGAVLQTTGRFTPHFREVTAGTHTGWLYVGDDPNHWTNLKSV